MEGMAFDTIIAGGGIIGCSIAWRLAQRGLRVLLLEAARLGAEASSAGAGMLAPGGEIEERSPWNDLALESLKLYPGFVAELSEETGCPIDFQRLGAVDVALSRKEWGELEARGQRQAALGIPSCQLTSRDLAQHAPLARQDVAGALFYPQDALVDPRDIMAALRSACEARSVEIREGARVTAMRARGGSVIVETSSGPFEAPAAVLAAGAWSSEIPVEGHLLPRAFPIRGHLAGYQLEPHSLGPLLRWGRSYLLQRSSGFTIAGTSSEQVGFDRTVKPAAIAEIHKRAAEVLPVLAACQPVETWVGFRPAVEGDRPAIGPVADTGVWLAYGHYRNGILMAPGTAQRVAQGIIASSEKGLSAPCGRP